MTSSSGVPVGTTVTLNQVVEYAQQKFALAFASLPPSPMIKDIPEAEATRYYQKMVQIGTTILLNSGKLRKPRSLANAEQRAGKENKQSPDEVERDAVKTPVTTPASTAEGRLVPVWAKFTGTPHFQLDMYAEGRKKMLKKEEFSMIAYLPQFEVVRQRPNRPTAFKLRKSLVIYYLLSEGTLESFFEPKKCHFLLHLRRACIVHVKKKEQGLRMPMFESGWQQHGDDLTDNEMDEDMLEVEQGIEALGLEDGNKCKRRRTSSDAVSGGYETVQRFY